MSSLCPFFVSSCLVHLLLVSSCLVHALLMLVVSIAFAQVVMCKC